MALSSPRVPSAGRVVSPLVLVGAVCGVAWAASLRTLMAEFAGAESTFDWFGTYEGILLPGAVVGGLLGWAAHLQRCGHEAPRWLVVAPLAFVLATPTVVVSVFVDGLGGGALAVPVVGIAGGYALAGRGPRWIRWVAGAVALLPVPGWLVAASIVGGPSPSARLGAPGSPSSSCPCWRCFASAAPSRTAHLPSCSRPVDGWSSWASSAAWPGVPGCGGSWQRLPTPRPR